MYLHRLTCDAEDVAQLPGCPHRRIGAHLRPDRVRVGPEPGFISDGRPESCWDYAHCIDGQAAANQRITDALGGQDDGQDPGEEGDGDSEPAA